MNFSGIRPHHSAGADRALAVSTAAGAGQIILLYGVLRTGLLLFLLFTFVIPSEAALPVRALIAASIFFPLGALTALVRVERSEDRFGETAVDDVTLKA
jgi:hypothetical protein